MGFGSQPTDHEKIKRDVENAVEKHNRRNLMIAIVATAIVSFVVGYLLKYL